MNMANTKEKEETLQ